MMQNTQNRAKVATYRVDHGGPAVGRFSNVRFHDYLYQKVPVLEFFLKDEPSDFTVRLDNGDVRRFAERVLEKERPDVVHICHPMRVCGFFEAALQLGIPCVATATDFAYICPKIVMTTASGAMCEGARGGRQCDLACPDTGGGNEARMALAERLLCRAGAVVAPSAFTADGIKRQIPQLDIRVIGHGLDTAGARRNTREYGPRDTVSFGFVGSIQRHKGVDVLVGAFMRTEAPNIRLLVFGQTGGFSENLQNRAKSDGRIAFRGGFAAQQREDVYGQIDVLVIPSVCGESYSLVKHEAILRNIPVIATDAGALGEGIVLGVNGYLYAPQDENALKNILEELAGDPSALNKVKQNLSSFAVTTTEQEAFQYLTLYRRLLAEKKAGDDGG
jgi:glycosyltransferase involved in cell wall biosynthesis